MKIISAPDMNLTAFQALEKEKEIQPIPKPSFVWVEEVNAHTAIIMKGIEKNAAKGYFTLHQDFARYPDIQALSYDKRKQFIDEVLTVFDEEGYTVKMQDYSATITW